MSTNQYWFRQIRNSSWDPTTSAPFWRRQNTQGNLTLHKLSKKKERRIPTFPFAFASVTWGTVSARLSRVSSGSASALSDKLKYQRLSCRSEVVNQRTMDMTFIAIVINTYNLYFRKELFNRALKPKDMLYIRFKDFAFAFIHTYYILHTTYIE